MATAETDEELLRKLHERVRVAPRRSMGAYDRPESYPPAPTEMVARAESQLAFPLPGMLRRIYEEVADGGFGPGYGVYPIAEGRSGPGRDETIVEVRDKLAVDPRWPERLLPLCEWGCAIWSCLDCRSDDGPIITLDGERPFANTGHTLRTWLSAWLEGVDLWEEMFEPGPKRMGINPFTKQAIEFKGHGKPRGGRWP